MNTDTINAKFQPATTKKGNFKGLYIVWKTIDRMHYANGTASSSAERYNIGKVIKKQKDTLITEKFDRVLLHNAYIVLDEALPEKWEKWDDVIGYRKIDKITLLSYFGLVI